MTEYGRYGKSLQGAAAGRFQAVRAARKAAVLAIGPRRPSGGRAVGARVPSGRRGMFVSYGQSQPAD